ncbi:MAG: hypothetical protein AB1938_30270 [Myxococcota bacterium]
MLDRIAALRPGQKRLVLTSPEPFALERLAPETRASMDSLRGPNGIADSSTLALVLFPLAGRQLPGVLRVVAVALWVLALVLAGVVGLPAIAVLCAGGLLAWLGARSLSHRQDVRPRDCLAVRPTHLVLVRGRRVQPIPLLSIRRISNQPGAGAIISVAGADPVRIETDFHLTNVLEAAARQRARLIDLLAADLLETELDLEPLSWASE